MSISYSSAIPENNKASYGEYDTVDFVLTFPNESLKLGSLRLEGELEVTQDGFKLLERAPGISVEEIIKATEGNLVVEGDIPEMQFA